MKIYLARHPSVRGGKGVCYGQKDMALAASFAEETARLRRKLPDLAGWRVYSSGLTRCRRTAEALAAGPVAIDPRLMELRFGDWEGRRWDELPEEETRPWSEDFMRTAPPGGETCQALYDRCLDFWRELAATGENSLVVTHIGWIRMALAHLLAMPPERAFRLEVDFCGLTLVQLEGPAVRVAYVNR